jgi:ribonuclease G
MNEIVINVEQLETRIARVEDKRVAELRIERHGEQSLVGNVYRGRVDSVVPGIQAAFVDIGIERNGFLYVGDIAAAEGTGDFDLEDVDQPKSKSRKSQRSSIEKILKKNQSIMVQVQKDTLGTKGVRLTNFVTLPGRFVVLMPTVQQIGISRKIEDAKERDRLKNILRSFRKNKPYGLILRTAGEGKPEEEILADLRYLNKQWDRIKKVMEKGDSTPLLHEDLGAVLRTVRDTFTEDVGRLTTDNEDALASIVEFLDVYAPGLKQRCRIYTGRKPLFERMGIEEQIEGALQRRVPLKSGGHIVIDQTEALIAIDVNTGKFTGKKALEDTVFKTNTEAAEEIAHQMRLRDLGGIIVVDFIDMEQESNRRKLLQTFREAIKKDRARITLSDIGELGMVEMTRKRVKHDLVRQLSQHCPYCSGAGWVRSVTTMTFDALRRMESFFGRSKEKNLILQAHPDVARRLRSDNKHLMDHLATEFERQIEVESISDFHIQELKVLSARTRKLLEDLSISRDAA